MKNPFLREVPTFLVSNFSLKVEDLWTMPQSNDKGRERQPEGASVTAGPSCQQDSSGEPAIQQSPPEQMKAVDR